MTGVHLAWKDLEFPVKLLVEGCKFDVRILFNFKMHEVLHNMLEISRCLFPWSAQPRFCHSAITGAEKDQDLVIQALMHEKENIRKRLLELFKQVDDDDSGTITLDEFERRFEEESVKNLFESLDLGTSDAWTLFQILDMDCNRYIDVDEFVDSCIRHRGSAKCVDVVGLTKQVRKVRDQLSTMSRAQARILKEFKTTQKTFLV